jgi:hypothetical protein
MIKTQQGSLAIKLNSLSNHNEEIKCSRLELCSPHLIPSPLVYPFTDIPKARSRRLVSGQGRIYHHSSPGQAGVREEGNFLARPFSSSGPGQFPYHNSVCRNLLLSLNILFRGQKRELI